MNSDLFSGIPNYPMGMGFPVQQGYVKKFGMNPMFQLAMLGREFQKIKMMQNPNLQMPVMPPWMQSFDFPKFPMF